MYYTGGRVLYWRVNVISSALSMCKSVLSLLCIYCALIILLKKGTELDVKIALENI